ncbi:hypothetical protein BU24DRAFT_216704 [Aaosphaeria arxii CBS 175.79]|uniref:Cerato-platanin n=1 Tax=Aaosphaeria arxii CBS 175.79 TaxID=1450172 RepID=A0A6A5XQL0_9PLEO|nr:uncharacterized protein BU24DRAFT_216704 [Aaosphaeria arxii CBS 175.79]KAF2014584.1 hypothetical protein BU24DRAFT_216704 [Aaosphaeria arxii CBS 175.79]
MFSSIATALTLASVAAATGVSITPHDKFSSSVGVLGCHIDTNRVAYFPSFPSCDSLCIKVKTDKAELFLLQIDQSGGAHDISYDAWNMLNSGESATSNPTMGGGIPAEVTPADMSDCADLIKTPDGKLPLMAANSIGFYVGCGADSWVGKNSALYNIQNSACTMGFNEVCELDLNVSNQPSCPHMLGAQNPLSGMTVEDINYGTGKLSAAQ